MARADRRRVRSKKPNAVSSTQRRDSDLVAIEDTLFFTRIRRHAKWMFVFLALAFGLGFVVFGIGSDQGTGIGDLLRDGGGASSGNISVAEAREQVQKNPESAQAQRNLATALQGEGETEEAIVALERYVQLKPKDQVGLRELAGLHLGQGSKFAQEAQVEQLRASYLTFGSTFGSSLQADGKPAIGTDPIDDAVSTQASQAVSAAYSKAQLSFQQAEQTYEKLVAIAPRDPNIQLELAQAAQQSGDYPKAIAAYQKFLKLAPDDPSASIVKQQIAQLKAAQTAPSSG